MQGLYLLGIRLRPEAQKEKGYPFSIPAVSALKKRPLTFSSPVTFFVGENGSGKSTLLEAAAVVCGFNPEGGSKNASFSTYDSHSSLFRYFTPVRGAYRERDGYFLRAESFYNVASYLEELDEIPTGAPLVLDSYGGSLHKKSHGESFFALLQNRLGGRGLYLFDEPEAALSPQRQLAMLCRIRELVKAGSQLLIATHSPMLMAYPGSEIYELSEDGICRKEYEQTDHYQITRRFLNDYPGFLTRLLE